MIVLKQVLVQRMRRGKHQREGTFVTNARNQNALKQVTIALDEIRTGIDNNLSDDLLYLDIRRALDYICEITSEVTN